MDTNTHLRIYQKYADKLESICRMYVSKAIIETILYDAWIDSANEALAEVQQEIKDGHNE